MWLSFSWAWCWASRMYVHDQFIGNAHFQDSVLKKSVCPPTPLSHWLTDPSQVDPSATAAVGKPAPGARRMVAIFDYDPRESSPNTDIEVRTADAFFLLYGAEMFADYLLCLLCPCPGWADLQCWRYHTCVWWHGRRWLLLRKSEND